MKVAIIASECTPFIKSGELADVVGSHAKELGGMDHEVIVIIPKYKKASLKNYRVTKAVKDMGVWMGDKEEHCSVYSTHFSENVTAYFIEFEPFFDRDGLYHDGAYNDYPDNPERFAFFSNAALQLCKAIDFKAEIIHAHDWQASLAMAYLKVYYWDDAVIGKASGILTIHNFKYQGIFGREHYGYTGLQDRNFTPDILEDHGNVNYLKGGIYFSDIVNTTSPTYAKETRTPEFSYGMSPFLHKKGDNYLGILSGVDYSLWNPKTDKLIPATYTAKEMKGKDKCKKKLQKQFKLKVKKDTPVIGVVSPFDDQRGLNLLADVIDRVVEEMNVQIVVVGSGDKKLEDSFETATKKLKGKVGTYIGTDDKLAHLVQAGSDFYIMPSRYEPFGPDQIYSMKYGTVPIVRATGGLEDTVEAYNEKTGKGTGFKFHDATPDGLYEAIRKAVNVYNDNKDHFHNMRKAAMYRHFSWEDSTREYIKVYEVAAYSKRKFWKY